MVKRYRLNGCMSTKGRERIKDGDIIPVGWFSESDLEKMIKKGTVEEVSKLPEPEKAEEQAKPTLGKNDPPEKVSKEKLSGPDQTINPMIVSAPLSEPEKAEGSDESALDESASAEEVSKEKKIKKK